MLRKKQSVSQHPKPNRADRGSEQTADSDFTSRLRIVPGRIIRILLHPLIIAGDRGTAVRSFGRPFRASIDFWWNVYPERRSLAANLPWAVLGCRFAAADAPGRSLDDAKRSFVQPSFVP